MCEAETRSLQIRITKRRFVQMCLAKLRSDQMRLVEIRSIQFRLVEPCSDQVCLVEISYIQLRPGEPCSLQMRTAESRSRQMRIVEKRSVQIRSERICTAQIAVTQIELLTLALTLVVPFSPTKHCQNGLDLSGWFLCYCIFILLFRWLFSRCWSILPDIRCEDFHDRPVVTGRIEGNALQRIDCAQPHLDIRLICCGQRTELLDSLRVSIRDVALFGYLDPAEGEIQRE